MTLEDLLEKFFLGFLGQESDFENSPIPEQFFGSPKISFGPWISQKWQQINNFIYPLTYAMHYWMSAGLGSSFHMYINNQNITQCLYPLYIKTKTEWNAKNSRFITYY